MHRSKDVHFRREWLTPREIGARAAAAALSDLAAMAATPLGLLLALALPQSWLPEIEEVARGVGEMASRTRCPIVGGNLSRADVLSLTITVLGSAVAPLTRAGARAGDSLYVTGTARRLGDRAAGADYAARRPRAAHRERFASPRPRLDEARWLAERGATCGDRHLRRTARRRGASRRGERGRDRARSIALSVRHGSERRRRRVERGRVRAARRVPAESASPTSMRSASASGFHSPRSDACQHGEGVRRARKRRAR